MIYDRFTKQLEVTASIDDATGRCTINNASLFIYGYGDNCDEAFKDYCDSVTLRVKGYKADSKRSSYDEQGWKERQKYIDYYERNKKIIKFILDL